VTKSSDKKVIRPNIPFGGLILYRGGRLADLAVTVEISYV
jgi:hypothetical protein